MAQDAQPVARFRRWRWLVASVACLAAAYWGWMHFASASGTRSQSRDAQLAAQPRRSTWPRSRPDFPVVLNGLGTVQATNTVTVRSRVDGQIEKVGVRGRADRASRAICSCRSTRRPSRRPSIRPWPSWRRTRPASTTRKQDLERTSILAKQGNATQQLLDQRTANVASLAAQVQADQAAIESAKVQLAYTTIRSPLDRARRLPPRRPRQHRARQRSDRHPDHHPAATDLRGVHRTRAAAARHQRRASRPVRCQVAAYTSDGKELLARARSSSSTTRSMPRAGRSGSRPASTMPTTRCGRASRCPRACCVARSRTSSSFPTRRSSAGPTAFTSTSSRRTARRELRNLEGRPGSRMAGRSSSSGLSPGERIVTSGHYRVQPGGPVEVLDDGARARPCTDADKVD